MTTNAPPPAPVLDRDVPCKQCGYSLRGLTPPGRCPECGFDIGESIRAHAERLRPLPPPDPKWARTIREGAWLSLAAFALALFAVLAPSAWYNLPFRNAPLSLTPGRIVFLAIACGWWVLAWASAWRLSTIEPPHGGRPSGKTWPRVARVLSSLYLIVPFMWAADPRQYKGRPVIYLVLLLLTCGLGGCFALLVRVGQLMRRRGWRVASYEARVLAVVVPAAAFFLADGVDGGPSSLTLLFDLPVYPYGMPVVYQGITEWLFNQSDQPLLWILLAIPTWSLSLTIRLLRAYGASTLRAPPSAPPP